MLQIGLLGPIEITREGKRIQGLESAKTMALLGYLALQPRPVPRQHLIRLLQDETLQHLLHDLSTHLPQTLEITSHSVHLRCEAPSCRVDVRHFLELSEGSTPDEWEEALALYRGEFLSGVRLPPGTALERWMACERDALRQRAVSVTRKLIAHHLRLGELEAATVLIARRLRMEPLSEEAHRQMMLIFARRGERDAALHQYALCRRMLEEEQGVPPSEETERLYRRLRLLSPPDRRLHLPPTSTPFVGREEELKRLVTLLRAPETRLITIVALGGMGKTRLALEAARRVVPFFLDGIYFVSLASLRQGETVPHAIAETLQLPTRRRTPREALLDYLREREVLLILDEMEALIDKATVLDELLAAAPGLTLLVTSRRPLRLPGETRLILHGLDCPPPGDDEPQRYSAVRLLLQSARGLRPDFDPPPATYACIGELCRALDGMPLAMEMAGAIATRLSCQAILNTLHAGPERLGPAFHELPPLYRNLHSLLASSWHDLGAEARRVLRRLAVFEGNFSLRAAEQVAGATPATLHRLALQALLQQVGEAYRMHALLRRYALERLESHPEEAARVYDAHAAYYAAFVEQQVPAFSRGHGLEEVGRCFKDIRAAWQRAIGMRRWATLDRMLEGIVRFYDLAGRFREGAWTLAILDAALQHEGVPDEIPPSLRIRLAIGRGLMAHRLGMPQEAKAHLEQALTLARRFEATAEEALALHLRGVIAWGEGRYEQAEADQRASLALARRLEDDAAIAIALRGLGVVLAATGRDEEARHCYEEGLVRLMAFGDLLGVASFHNNLGILASNRRAWEEAEAHYRRSLELRRQLGDRRGEAKTLMNLGNVAHRQGHFEEARRYHQASLETFHEIGDRRGVAFALNNLGNVALSLGEEEKAIALLRESIRLKESLGDLPGVANSLNNLGFLQLTRGAFEEARRTFHKAAQLALQTGARSYALESLSGLARLALAEGKGEQAATLAAYILHQSTPHPYAMTVATEVWEQSREQLSPSRLEQCRREGEQLTLEQALQQAE